MSKFLPLATAILCLGLLTLGILVFDPAYLPPYPLPGQNNLQPTMAEVLARKEQLHQFEKELGRYWEAKEHVAVQVIARRCSLKDAIEAFRQLDQPWISASFEQQTLKELGISEEEWRGRNVIAFARRVLPDRPDEAAAVADRLEKELRELLADRKKHRPMQTDPRIETAQRSLEKKQGGR